MAVKGICEICGFADDSYRIEENGAVMKVCKLCYDGYHERMGTSAEAADKTALSNQTANISLDDIPPDDKAEIARILKEEKKVRSRVPTLNATQLDMVLEPSDDDKRVLSNVRRRQLRKERRAAVKGEQVAWADVGESDGEEEETVKSVERPPKPKPKPKSPVEKPTTPGKEVLRARIQSVIEALDGADEVLWQPQTEQNEADIDTDIPERKLEAETMEPPEEKTETEETAEALGEETEEETESGATENEASEEAKKEPLEEEAKKIEEAPEEEETESPAETVEIEDASAQKEQSAEPEDEAGPETETETTSEEIKQAEECEPEAESEGELPAEELSEPEEKSEEKSEAEPEQNEEIDDSEQGEESEPEFEPTQEADEENIAAQTTENREETEMAKQKAPDKLDERMKKAALEREKIHAEANQTTDDERISITSPEVAIRQDVRPKTNLDVAISEYTGGVKFFNAFKYVMHRATYSIFLAVVVIAVSTVMFVIDSWQHAAIVLGGGAGSIAVGCLLMWYLSHCYELDRRALLLRIRQQEILFDSMGEKCYRELRTKFTMIKALGWLLNKLTVLLPFIIVLGGNIAAVVVGLLMRDTVYFWLFPVISAGASVAAVLVYYIVKFLADWIAYALDRERNQQIQQQTLLDMLAELRESNRLDSENAKNSEEEKQE